MLDTRVTRKMTKYGARCSNRGQTFQPFVVSTLGLLVGRSGTLWQQMVRRLGSTRAGHFGQEEVASLHQRLSLALMRGVGNQLASMGQVRELDPIDKWGNERAPRQRKRTKTDLERLVRDILDEGSTRAASAAHGSSSASSVAGAGLLLQGPVVFPSLGESTPRMD